MPVAENLPVDLQGLARRNALELSDKRWEYDQEQLLRLLKKRVEVFKDLLGPAGRTEDTAQNAKPTTILKPTVSVPASGRLANLLKPLGLLGLTERTEDTARNAEPTKIRKPAVAVAASAEPSNASPKKNFEQDRSVHPAANEQQDNNKIFISYRRAKSNFAARAIYQHLITKNYDVFIDLESIDSGEYQPVILSQIEARRHFIVILQPGSLDRTANEANLMRREIECALQSRRNIIPILADSFSFDGEESKFEGKIFPGKLNRLKDHNSIILVDEYFEAAMEKLVARFLKARRT